MSESLLLKWGTLKGWHFESEESEAFKLAKKYLKNSPMSCAMDHPDEDRKKMLCEIIDKLDGEIKNDWTGEMLTKDQAKKYVMEYGKKEA